MAYMLVWICTDIIDDLVQKYGRGWMETIDGKEIYELFQCPECESSRIAESEVVAEDNIIDMAGAQKQTDFLRRVAEHKVRESEMLTPAEFLKAKGIEPTPELVKELGETATQVSKEHGYPVEKLMQYLPPDDVR